MRWRIIIFISVACCITLGIAFFILYGPWAFRPSGNSRIVSTIDQTRTVMTYIHYKEGNYDNFNCEHKEMVILCQKIEKSYRAKDGKEPIIAHDAPNDSQAVCIYSLLNAKKAYWYCADSTGRAGYTEINPGSPGYCVDGKSAICPPFLE